VAGGVGPRTADRLTPDTPPNVAYSQMLPHEQGCGSGMTCWRRLRDWQNAGTWDLIHFALLDWLARHDQIDWTRAVVDSCSVWAVCGGSKTGPNPTDRAKRGSKRHVICDGQGVPLAVRLTVPTGMTRRKRCRWSTRFRRSKASEGDHGRPDCVLGDRAYDAEAIRDGLRAPHIHPLLAVRRTRHGSGLGRWRWVVERTFAWLNQFSSPAHPLRQTDRHPRGVPVSWLRTDLLAVPSEDMGD
jgi:transposase